MPRWRCWRTFFSRQTRSDRLATASTPHRKVASNTPALGGVREVFAEKVRCLGGGRESCDKSKKQFHLRLFPFHVLARLFFNFGHQTRGGGGAVGTFEHVRFGTRAPMSRSPSSMPPTSWHFLGPGTPKRRSSRIAAKSQACLTYEDGLRTALAVVNWSNTDLAHRQSSALTGASFFWGRQRPSAASTSPDAGHSTIIFGTAFSSASSRPFTPGVGLNHPSLAWLTLWSFVGRPTSP